MSSHEIRAAATWLAALFVASMFITAAVSLQTMA